MRRFSPRGLLIGATAALLALALAAVAWVQASENRLLSQAVRYQDEYLQISLNQLQTESLRLRIALQDTLQRQPLDTHSLQLRYDIFVSRVDLLDAERGTRLIDRMGDFAPTVAQVKAVVARADEVLGPKPLRAASAETLRPILSDLESVDAPIQSLMLEASHAVSTRLGDNYGALRQHNRAAILLTALLSFCSLGFALLALTQLRQVDQRRRALEAAAAELHDARSAAESANQAKTSFLANMSHEIRTPFQGLLGMLQLLDAAPLEATQRRQLQVARESAQHLLAILNDVLDISRLEAGVLTLHPEAVALRQMAAEVLALMAAPAAQKKLSLNTHIAASLPDRAVLDDTRVRQVLFNLLSNAIKFTERGGVVLEVVTRGDELVFAVADTGIGIDDSTLGRLFQRFSQGDSSTSRRYGGTGLGLEISRSLARLMGGDVTVTSAPGAGSRFELRLPLREAAPEFMPTQPAWPDSRQRRLRVLVAEDNEVNREVLAAMIEREGHDPHFAHDGLAALEAARSSDFDLVLMDLHMPEMDGLAASRAIRSLPGARARVPIAALTADAFADTRERCLDAGMNDFLSKPVSVSALARLLGMYAEDTAGLVN